MNNECDEDLAPLKVKVQSCNHNQWSVFKQLRNLLSMCMHKLQSISVVFFNKWLLLYAVLYR